ncbi:MAG: 2-amino-4-hydroxy-6-hydroxymethyldihydropteridine diphosphokinase [Chthoniobacterales bacterium]
MVRPSSTPRPAGLALGSNLGERAAHLRAARDFLATLHEGEDPPAVSPVYETDPVDCPPGSAAFLNAVLEIDTSRRPEELLGLLGEFERRLGRSAQRERNAPRPVDIDILYVGDRRIESPELVVPHPRLAARRFVLQPLADIRPGLVLPGHRCTVAALLAALPANPAVRRAPSVW